MGKKEKLTQLSCLMEKLYKIDAELGGTAKKRKRLNYQMRNMRKREEYNNKCLLKIMRIFCDSCVS